MEGSTPPQGRSERGWSHDTAPPPPGSRPTGSPPQGKRDGVLIEWMVYEVYSRVHPLSALRDGRTIMASSPEEALTKLYGGPEEAITAASALVVVPREALVIFDARRVEWERRG